MVRTVCRTALRFASEARRGEAEAAAGGGAADADAAAEDGGRGGGRSRRLHRGGFKAAASQAARVRGRGAGTQGGHSVSPSRIFIERPVATSLMMAGVVLVGFVAFRQLPVSALPQVDYPTMQIQTFYPGASPEVMTSSVTAPLEKQFGQVPGMTQMTSISSFGSSLITLQFALDLNIDIAEQEVQAAINAAGTFLRRTFPIPPIYSKTNPADAPILTLAITSPYDSAAEGRGTGRDAHGAANFAAARASDWSASAADSGPRCGCRPIRLRWLRTG